MDEVVFPWPPKELSPNARVHWAVKAKAVKTYRSICYIVCRQAKINAPATLGKLVLHINFHPPRNGRNDLDNSLSRIKALIDSISDYLGIDDCMFNYNIAMREKIIGGCVKIRISGE